MWDWNGTLLADTALTARAVNAARHHAHV